MTRPQGRLSSEGSLSGLLRVRVLAVLGRIATAVHPASSAVGHVDVVRMEPLLPSVTIMVTPAGVGRGDRETDRDTDRDPEGEDDAHDADSFRDQRGGCARNAGFSGISDATRREELVNIIAFLYWQNKKRR
jgi:hypothetical protein